MRPLTNPQSEGCSVVSLLKQMAERHARSEEPLLDEEQWRFFISQCYLYHLRRLRHWLASLYQDSVEAATEWTSDSVILAAAREVWFKFVREEKWTPTLRAASNPDSGLTAEQAARGYVSKTAIHDIQHLLGEKSVDYTLYEKVGRALSGLEFHRSDEGAISCWVPVEGKDWPLNPQLNLRELADSIGFVRGRSRGHQNFPDIDFPTPLQIAKLVRKVCIERRITLTRDQILEVLHGVFRVPDDRDLRTNRLNDNTDGYTGGESTFPDIKEDNAVAGEIAEKLIAETCERQGIEPGQLTVHADRGTSMTSKPVALLLSDLGVTKTHSRPHVSDDNPFSEAQFKTMKYRPDFPERFVEIEEARRHGVDFFDWYNNDHHHAGLGMLTPADVHFGRVDQRIAERQAALDAAFAAHPERFVRGRPIAARPPREVWINKPSTQPELGAPAGGTVCPSPAETRCHRAERRAIERPEPPGTARRGESLTNREHGEDGEDATLPGASTVAPCHRDGQTPLCDNVFSH